MLRTILVLMAALVGAVVLALVMPFEVRPEQEVAFWHVTWVYLAFTLTCAVVGEITGNVSQVDKSWSVVPSIYAWLFALESSWNPRVVLMAVVITIWSIRLTYNFTRRGGFSWPPWSGEEDYRWEVLRNIPLFKGHRFRWTLFNFGFICGYQMSLIYLFTLPVLLAWTDQPLGIFDGVLAAAVVGLVAIEWLADQQQYDFQEEKWRQIREEGAARFPWSVGFTHHGLWAWSRHPNYAAEQTIWLCIYLFSVVATGALYNPTAIGIVLLIMLFVGSSDFSEGISLKKYPAYQTYVDALPRFWPMPWSRPWKPSEPSVE
ncbi:MAG: DUF1295 domain-containing protein [Myxococcota bacterium]